MPSRTRGARRLSPTGHSSSPWLSQRTEAHMDCALSDLSHRVGALPALGRISMSNYRCPVMITLDANKGYFVMTVLGGSRKDLDGLRILHRETAAGSVERLDTRGVQLRASFPVNDIECLLHRRCPPIGTGRGQCIVDVGDGDDSGDERD